jgi:hypothetical protein
MKKLLLAAATLAALSVPAFAFWAMTTQEIAKLPQDKVQAIKIYCERRWGTNFEMRAYCEDNQYEALKTLIERDK